MTARVLPPLSIQVVVNGITVLEWTDPESAAPETVALAVKQTGRMLMEMPRMYAAIGVEEKPEHSTKIWGVP